MNRTLFFVLLCVSLGGCSVAHSERKAAQPHPEPAGFPAFSWKTVPQWGFLSVKSGEDLTDDQVRHLAHEYAILTLCKHKPADPRRNIEGEMLRMANRIKVVNSGIKLLYYWNTTLAMPGSLAYQDFASRPDHVLHDIQGRPLMMGKFEYMDTSKASMRDWWASAAGKAVHDSPFDGVFADAVCKYGMGSAIAPNALPAGKRQALADGLFDMLKAAQQRMGPGKLLVFNGLRGNLRSWKHGGVRYLDCSSGAIVEHFAGFSGRDSRGRVIKEWLANDIELIGRAARRGKLVLVKGWPGNHSWLSSDFKALTDEDRRRILRENLTFPLAAYLIAAEAYCYFDYSLGYLSNCGMFEDLDDLHRPLGAPRGAAMRNDWIYTREFEHASVWLDIENEKARIEWK